MAGMRGLIPAATFAALTSSWARGSSWSGADRAPLGASAMATGNGGGGGPWCRVDKLMSLRARHRSLGDHDQWPHATHQVWVLPPRVTAAEDVSY